MKVAIINTKQRSGGAAIAAFSLFKALQQEGVDATFITAEHGKGKGIVVLTDNFVKRIKYKVKFLWERLGIWFVNGFSRKGLFSVSTANSGFNLVSLPEVRDADIIHLHWINQGLLSIKDIEQLIATKKPIVITTHDMWYSTAICHYAGICNKQCEGCRNCPQLSAYATFDLAERVWKQKKGLYKDNVTFVAISQWTEMCLKKSLLTSDSKRVVIPNAVDGSLFFEHDRMEIRRKLGIKQEEVAVAFGAAKLNAPIKGSDMLFDAIRLCNIKERLVLILFGNIKNDSDFLSRVPCRYIYMGSVDSKEKEAEIYSAADFTAVPSHYETFSLVVAESMLCGTPAIAFDNSATAEHIIHKETGYVVRYSDINDFKTGIEWLADNSSDMRLKCMKFMRDKVNPRQVAKQHVKLYKSLLTE